MMRYSKLEAGTYCYVQFLVWVVSFSISFFLQYFTALPVDLITVMIRNIAFWWHTGHADAVISAINEDRTRSGNGGGDV